VLVKGQRSPIRADEVKSILIIQLGDIGDVVWSTPTVRAVAAAFPQATVSLLLRAGCGDLLRGDPAVRAVFEVPRTKGFVAGPMVQIRFIRVLRRESFDLVFDLRSDDRGAYMAFLSGAPVRAALYYPGYTWRNRFFTHLAPLPRIEKRHPGAVDQSLYVVEGFGVSAPSDARPALRVTREMESAIDIRISNAGLKDSPWITVNPFSRWSYKELPLETWAEVISGIHADYPGIATVIVGTKEEHARAQFIVERSPGNVRNMAGTTTLAELAALLRHSRLHVGVDSAAPHIAAAVGTPTVTIYGPTDWRDWAPAGDKHTVIKPVMSCSPCHEKGCNGSGKSRCLEEMTSTHIIAGLSLVLDTVLLREIEETSFV